ncbi:DUF3316 domain-containing protein [Leucothrix pacifica]|uniref:Uncharacterized protein n=1 Tax=Leucothrix pacifica TaxID=1247513 RepID=A0A317C899_9GAMM|nr:DUF3316 domain-containing protein [Leucothrix pacifica]PWQ92362.1 hypothetical protein DKW60_21710 [Leucothrix pacifica]
MKTLSKLIAASLLIVSVSASAFTTSETIETPVAATKAAAYEQGVSKLSSLQGSTPGQLNYRLGTYYGDIKEDTLRINDGGFVTVQERAMTDGSIGYVGIVNVDVSFERNENDR